MTRSWPSSRQYTRESGVRQLERQVGAVARKVARKLAAGEAERTSTITADDVRELLGRPKVHPEHAGEAERGRRGHRDVLHARWAATSCSSRRPSVACTAARSTDETGAGRRMGQRVADPDRSAWRCDEGVGPRGADLRGDARLATADPRGPARFDRGPRPRARRARFPRTARRPASPWPRRSSAPCRAAPSARTSP